MDQGQKERVGAEMNTKIILKSGQHVVIEGFPVSKAIELFEGMTSIEQTMKFSNQDTGEVLYMVIATEIAAIVEDF